MQDRRPWSRPLNATADAAMDEVDSERLIERAARVRHPLDLVNFFLADVRGGLSPFLAVHLLTEWHWGEASIGAVMSIAEAAGIFAQTPSGAIVDFSRAKRALIAVAALIVTAASLILPWFSVFWMVACLQAMAQAASTFFGPGIAAITLGSVGRQAFSMRVGRNEAFNHGGNACGAVVAGAAAYMWGSKMVFYLLAGMALATLVSVATIPANAIDHDLARGLDGAALAGCRSGDRQPSGFQVLVTSRPLLIFAVCSALFFVAEVAMLPLVGEKLASQNTSLGATLMSACVVGTQFVIAAIALLAGSWSDRWGRKPLVLAAFLLLPVRGVLYTLSDDPYWLMGVQMLGGVVLGIYLVTFPAVVADIMRGTGRFNVAQAGVSTAQGIGAVLSTMIAGFVTQHFGHSAAFLTLAGCAASGALLFWLAMPETIQRTEV
jgi:predicted MFS family arabinose efflux permease